MAKISANILNSSLLSVEGEKMILQRKFKNLLGRIRGKGQCVACGDSWDWKKPLSIPYAKYKSAHNICEECVETLPEDQLVMIALTWLSQTTWRLPLFISYTELKHNLLKSVRWLKNRETVEPPPFVDLSHWLALNDK